MAHDTNNNRTDTEGPISKKGWVHKDFVGHGFFAVRLYLKNQYREQLEAAAAEWGLPSSQYVRAVIEAVVSGIDPSEMLEMAVSESKRETPGVKKGEKRERAVPVNAEPKRRGRPPGVKNKPKMG